MTLYITQSVDTLFIYKNDLSEYFKIMCPLKSGRSWESRRVNDLSVSKSNIKSSFPFSFDTYEINQNILGPNEFTNKKFFIDPNNGIIQMDLSYNCTVCNTKLKEHWQLIMFN